MNLVPVNALKSPRRLRERLLQEHELIVTNNGRPMALMVEVRQGEDPEVPLRAFREVRSRLALSAVRRTAAERGTDRLGLTAINDVIAAARTDRESARG
jgi:antitoxin (DNA-binding transcriptional repressor) of toxin-antitoxin stability system